MKYLVSLLVLILAFQTSAQVSLEYLLVQKWYVCDTNFNFKETKVIYFSSKKKECTNTITSKSGDLEFKKSGDFILNHFMNCGELEIMENGGRRVGSCEAHQNGKFRIEKNNIWFEENKYNIDVLDENFLLLRRD